MEALYQKAASGRSPPRKMANRSFHHLSDPLRSASTNSPGAPLGRPPAPSIARPRLSTAWAPSPSTGAGATPCPASPTACGRIPPPGLLRAPRIPRRPRPPARPVAGHPRSRLLLRLAQKGVVARIVPGPHDANRQDHPHLPMRYHTGRPRSVIRLRISQPRTASLPCPAGLRARRPSPMMDL